MLLAGWVCVVGLACGGQWASIDPRDAPERSDFPDDHAVVLLADMTAAPEWSEAHKAPRWLIQNTLRRKILTETGRKQLERFSINYDEQLEELGDVRARIVRPDGTQVEVDDSEDHPVGGSGSILHTSRRLRVVSFEAAAPGDIIEVRWTTRSTVIFQPLLFDFGDRYPVISSRVRVRTSAGVEVATRFTQMGAEVPFEPTRVEEGGETLLVWERRDYEPLRGRYYYLPPRRLRSPMLRIALRAMNTPDGRKTFFDEWSDYGSWYQALSHGTDRATDAVRAAAARVLEGVDPGDTRETVRRLFRHVQEDIRYVAIELGMGGWRPHTADEVARQQLGDCKDKANYLKSLLSTRGIDSHLAIIGTRDVFGADAPGANLRRANHAILAIDRPEEGAPQFLDPTCRACAFGRLPWADEDTDVLVVGPGPARIARTPMGDARSNTVTSRYRATVDPEGSASFEFESSATGQIARARRAALLQRNPEERMDYVRDLAFDNRRRTVRGTDYSALDALDAPMKIEAHGRVTALAEGTASSRVLSVHSFVDTGLSRIKPKRPRAPAHFSYPATRTVEVELELPHHDVSWIAPDVEVATPFASYRREVSKTDKGARIARTLTLEVRELPESQIPALRAFLDAVHRHDGEGLVLTLANEEGSP